jgi:hypothetical protein
VWAGRPSVLEEVQRLQTRWDKLASGSVSQRENLEVEMKVCMDLLQTAVINYYKTDIFRYEIDVRR